MIITENCKDYAKFEAVLRKKKILRCVCDVDNDLGGTYTTLCEAKFESLGDDATYDRFVIYNPERIFIDCRPNDRMTGSVSFAERCAAVNLRFDDTDL